MKKSGLTAGLLNIQSSRMTSKFEAEGIVLIRGRGLVVIGQIREGRIKVGMTFSLPPIPGKLTILALEWPVIYDKDGNRVRGRIGLLFSLGNDQENAIWKGMDVSGQLIDVNDPD